MVRIFYVFYFASIILIPTFYLERYDLGQYWILFLMMWIVGLIVFSRYPRFVRIWGKPLNILFIQSFRFMNSPTFYLSVLKRKLTSRESVLNYTQFKALCDDLIATDFTQFQIQKTYYLYQEEESFTALLLIPIQPSYDKRLEKTHYIDIQFVTGKVDKITTQSPFLFEAKEFDSQKNAPLSMRNNNVNGYHIPISRDVAEKDLRILKDFLISEFK